MTKKISRLKHIPSVRKIEEWNLEQLCEPHPGLTDMTIGSRRDARKYLDITAYRMANSNPATKGATHYMFTEQFYQNVCAFVFYKKKK